MLFLFKNKFGLKCFYYTDLRTETAHFNDLQMEHFEENKITYFNAYLLISQINTYLLFIFLKYDQRYYSASMMISGF